MVRRGYDALTLGLLRPRILERPVHPNARERSAAFAAALQLVASP